MLCKNCFKYGHPAVRCNGPKLCANCVQSGHEKSACDNPVQCNYCKKDHQTGSKFCPENVKQQSISNIMTEKKLSYFEAAKQFRADTYTGFPSLNDRRQDNEKAILSEMAELRLLVESLQVSVKSLHKVVEEKDTIINDLNNRLAKQSSEEQQVIPTPIEPVVTAKEPSRTAKSTVPIDRKSNRLYKQKIKCTIPYCTCHTKKQKIE